MNKAEETPWDLQSCLKGSQHFFPVFVEHSLLEPSSHATMCCCSVLSRVRLFATPWTTACWASLSITNSQSLLKLISIESVMPSSHLILCRPLLLLPSLFPSIRVFSNELVLHIRWPTFWSFGIKPQLGHVERDHRVVLWEWSFGSAPANSQAKISAETQHLLQSREQRCFHVVPAPTTALLPSPQVKLHRGAETSHPCEVLPDFANCEHNKAFVSCQYVGVVMQP